MTRDPFELKWKTWALASSAIAATAIGIWGAQAFQTHLRLGEADAQLKKGFAALASATLEPIRDELTSSTRGCAALLAAYYGARNAERLEWASQACLMHGIENSDTYIGWAAAREILGRDADAIQILEQASKKFSSSPDPLYRLAQAYRRVKKEPESAAALFRAWELAPENHALAMEALEANAASQQWAQARKIAEKLGPLPTEEPEVKLLIARAILRGGGLEGARPILEQARALMIKKPDNQIALEKAYSDVYSALTPPIERKTASLRPLRPRKPHP